ncbi:MAG: hypothetical protein F4X76_10075 [Chloroflexi bacterium]|nr:hypothetical protein [Chloroflexota bacterium]
MLQSGDVAFSTIDNDAEMQVLAASTIVALFEEEGLATDTAALCVATGTFGDRAPEATPDLDSLAHDYLSRRAVSIRPHEEPLHTSALTPAQMGVGTKLSNQVEEALGQNDYAAAVTALNGAVSNLAKRLENVAASDVTARNQLVQSLAALSEENDILWWVINDYSRELSRPRGQASPQGLVLPSAYELASLVTHDVPPTASIEYLRHALASAEGEAPIQLTVAEAMEATTPDWRDSATAALPEEAPGHVLPLLAGLRIMGETPAAGDWNQALRDRTGLGADFADAPEEVGLQLLRELLLTRCLGNS